MKRDFADTYYFIALLSESEPKHVSALEFAATFRGDLVTTGWILTELGNGFARSPERLTFIALWDRITQSPRIRVVGCSDELLAAGFNLYRRRPDKAWSLTDCISFVVMEREQIQEALTGDHHFEQAGFTALLK
jgi:predicted nucleic acid-binding protein